MTRPDFGPGAVHDERPDDGPDPRLEDEWWRQPPPEHHRRQEHTQ